LSKFLNDIKLDKKKNKDTRNLDIGDFLIKPLQRICKYPLLIKGVLSFTGEKHVDYNSLVDAGVKLEILLNEINTRMLESEK